MLLNRSKLTSTASGIDSSPRNGPTGDFSPKSTQDFSSPKHIRVRKVCTKLRGERPPRMRPASLVPCSLQSGMKLFRKNPRTLADLFSIYVRGKNVYIHETPMHQETCDLLWLEWETFAWP